MSEQMPKPLRVGLFVVVASTVVLGGSSAFAHKINVFAYAQGNEIHGEVYFRGRIPAQNAKVTAFDPEGEKLEEVTADAEGKFAFQPRFRCDHRLVVDTGDGHAAEYTITAAELPDDLPPRPGDSTKSGPSEPKTTASPPHHHHHAPATLPNGKKLQEMIEAAVSRQVTPLRKQLAQYEAKTRLRDILGGIGYILGIMGLVYYFLGLRKKKTPDANPTNPTHQTNN